MEATFVRNVKYLLTELHDVTSQNGVKHKFVLYTHEPEAARNKPVSCMCFGFMLQYLNKYTNMT
jgi:hypothetical protein